MRLSIFSLIIMSLFLGVFTSCGPERQKPSKKFGTYGNKPNNKPNNKPSNENKNASEQDLEAAKAKTRMMEQKLKDAQRNLENAVKNGMKGVEEKRQELLASLVDLDKKNKINVIENVKILVSIIENNSRKSKNDILIHLRKNQKSKSDILIAYFQLGQKPTNDMLEKLNQEEINLIQDDLVECIKFIFDDTP